MQLTIQLSDKTVRKMRALAVLQESDNSDFMAMVSEYIDAAVSEKIAQEIGYNVPSAPPTVKQAMKLVAANASKHPASLQDHAIAEGLAYEQVYDEEEETQVPVHVKATAKGLRVEDLQNDEPPEVGGVVSGATEMTFAEAFGLGEDMQFDAEPSSPEENPFQIRENPPETVKIPRSTTPKRLPKNVKAVVGEYTGNASETF